MTDTLGRAAHRPDNGASAVHDLALVEVIGSRTPCTSMSATSASKTESSIRRENLDQRVKSQPVHCFLRPAYAFVLVYELRIRPRSLRGQHLRLTLYGTLSQRFPSVWRAHSCARPSPLSIN